MATIGIKDTRTDEEKGIHAKSSRMDYPLSGDPIPVSNADYETRQRHDVIAGDPTAVDINFSRMGTGLPVLSPDEIAAERERLVQNRRASITASTTQNGQTVERTYNRDASGNAIVPSGESRPRPNLALAANLLNQNALITNIAMPPSPATPSRQASGGQAPAPAAAPPPSVQEVEQAITTRTQVQERTAPAGSFKSSAAKQASMNLTKVGIREPYTQDSVVSRVADAAAGGGSPVSLSEIDQGIEKFTSGTQPRTVNEQRDVAETVKSFKKLRAEVVQSGRAVVSAAGSALDPLDPTTSPQDYRNAVSAQVQTLEPRLRRAVTDYALQNAPASVGRAQAIEADVEARVAQQKALAPGELEKYKAQIAADSAQADIDREAAREDAYQRSKVLMSEELADLSDDGTVAKDFQTLSTDPRYEAAYRKYLEKDSAGETAYTVDANGRVVAPAPVKLTDKQAEARRLQAAEFMLGNTNVKRGAASDKTAHVAKELETYRAGAADRAARAPNEILTPPPKVGELADKVFEAMDDGKTPYMQAVSAVVGPVYDKLAVDGRMDGITKEQYIEAAGGFIADKVDAKNTQRHADENESYRIVQDNKLEAFQDQWQIAALAAEGIAALQNETDPVKLEEGSIAWAEKALESATGMPLVPTTLSDSTKEKVRALIKSGASEARTKEFASTNADIVSVRSSLLEQTGNQAFAVEASRYAATKTADGKPVKALSEDAATVAVRVSNMDDTSKAKIDTALKAADPQGPYAQFGVYPANARQVLAENDIYNVDTPAHIAGMTGQRKADAQWKYSTTPPVLGGGVYNMDHAEYQDTDTLKSYMALNDQTAATYDPATGSLDIPKDKINVEYMNNLNLLTMAVLQRDEDNTDKFAPVRETVKVRVSSTGLWGPKRKFRKEDRELPGLFTAAIVNGLDVPEIAKLLNSDSEDDRVRGALKAVNRQIKKVGENINGGLLEANTILAGVASGVEPTVENFRSGAFVPRQDPQTLNTAGYALSLGQEAVDAGNRGDSDAVDTRQEALQSAHLAFRNRVMGDIPEMEAAGYDAAKFKRIDDAFVEARRMTGDVNAFGGFGAEGAARFVVDRILSGAVRPGAPLTVRTPDGYTVSVDPLSATQDMNRVGNARMDALRAVMKAAGVRAMTRTPADVERAWQLVVDAEVRRTADARNPLTPAEVNDMIRGRMTAAADAATQEIVGRYEKLFARQDARGSRAAAVETQANLTADALYE